MEFLGIKHVKQCLMFVLIMLYIYYYDFVIIKGLHGFPFELSGNNNNGNNNKKI